MRKWSLVLGMLCLLLLPGVALAHSMPLRARWLVQPGQPVAGRAAQVRLELHDQLGGAAEGYSVTLRATARGQDAVQLALQESAAGVYTGELTLPATGAWKLQVTVRVLDEDQVGTQRLQVVAAGSPAGAPLKAEQWLRFAYSTTHLVLTWGAAVAGVVLVVILLLTGRRPIKLTGRSEE